jgi:hypothetical protein
LGRRVRGEGSVLTNRYLRRRSLAWVSSLAGRVRKHQKPWELKMLRMVHRMSTHHLDNLGPRIEFGIHIVLKPNYTRDTVSVYCHVTRFLIRRAPRVLDVLDHVQHFSNPATGSFSSWVSKWFELRSASLLAVGYFTTGILRWTIASLRSGPRQPLTG